MSLVSLFSSALPNPIDHLVFNHLLSMRYPIESGSMVKNLPAMQEIQVPSLGQEYPLEEEMATHSNILVWEIPWTGGTW